MPNTKWTDPLHSENNTGTKLVTLLRLKASTQEQIWPDLHPALCVAGAGTEGHGWGKQSASVLEDPWRRYLLGGDGRDLATSGISVLAADSPSQIIISGGVTSSQALLFPF